MYVRTACAWYILDGASAQYEGFEIPFLNKVCFFNDLFHAAAGRGNEGVDYASFVKEHPSTNGEDDLDDIVRVSYILVHCD